MKKLFGLARAASYSSRMRRMINKSTMPGRSDEKPTFGVRIEENHQTMDREHERRARNEAIFREVNERVEEVSTGLAGFGESDSLLVGYVCECGLEDCSEPIEVTRAQYEAARAYPRRFLVLPGHEDTDAARVVERHPHFLVVEKIGKAAAIADEHDPRS